MHHVTATPASITSGTRLLSRAYPPVILSKLWSMKQCPLSAKADILRSQRLLSKIVPAWFSTPGFAPCIAALPWDISAKDRLLICASSLAWPWGQAHR